MKPLLIILLLLIAVFIGRFWQEKENREWAEFHQTVMSIEMSYKKTLPLIRLLQQDIRQKGLMRYTADLLPGSWIENTVGMPAVNNRHLSKRVIGSYGFGGHITLHL